MMSSENLPEKNYSSLIFWLFIMFLACFSAWAYYFKLEKSVIVTGEVKPMGFPILVQSRFEAKVKEVSVSEGAWLKKVMFDLA